MGTLSERTLSLLLAADGDTSTAEWCRWAGGGGEGKEVQVTLREKVVQPN